MRNAPSEAADRVHLLGLKQLRFHPQAGSKVAAIANKMSDDSGGVPYGTDAFVEIVQTAVLLAVHHDAAIDVTRTNGFPKFTVESGGLLSRFQNRRSLANDLFAGITA